MNIPDSMSVVYGSPPYGWTTPDRLSSIQAMLMMFPKIRDRVVPLTTYLLYAKSSLRLDLVTRYEAVFSERMRSSFVDHLDILRNQASVQVPLDDGNFKAEVTAFANMEMAIMAPHLDVSPLYRYMVAIQQGMLMCVDDNLVADAVSCLRTNPYLYFAYGQDFEDLMPIAWGDL